MRKSITLLLASCGLVVTSASAQIIQSVVPDIGIWGPINNTGIAIAPDMHWNAIAFDDGSGNYYVDWRESVSGVSLDLETNSGSNPDIAYYSNIDAAVVGYENGGDIWVDAFYLTGFVDYSLFTSTPIMSGTNPNIDMNSPGRGALVWQDGSDIWACAFGIGSFSFSTPVMVGNGEDPDIALLDDNSNVVITYTQGGMLIIESFDFGDLSSGIVSLTSSDMITPSGTGFEHPRIQSNRNANYGPADFYTVVAQDDLGGSQYLIHGLFYTGLGSYTHHKLNLHAYNCFSPDPLPVVAYERSQVHVAWAQEYDAACSGITPVDLGQDVLMAECDFMGNNLNGLTVFLEVNNLNSDFSNSKTSINTEYDGNYSINNSNWCEGLAYDYPGDLLWKKRDAATPFFRTSGPDKFTVKVDKGVTSNVITVEVANSDESITEGDLEMTFALYDQSGRIVEIPTFEQEGMIYRIDASTLEHGIYLLHYTLNGDTKAVRIPHFTN
jgi:hypothetical protein